MVATSLAPTAMGTPRDGASTAAMSLCVSVIASGALPADREGFMPKFPGIHHSALTVSDPDRSVPWSR